MSRALETKVAQLVQSKIDGLVEVRVGEQLAVIPKDKLCTVNLDAKRPKNSSFSNVFENTFKITLMMHYADNTEQEMESVGESIHLGLLDPDNFNDDSNVLHHQVQEMKKVVTDNNWIQEINYLLVAVDTES